MGYYSNYLIKSIIRRIVNLLINRRTLKILLFVLIIGLIFFKICNNTTFAATIISDTTYYDGYEANISDMNALQNDFIVRLEGLGTESAAKNDFMTRIQSGEYALFIYYGDGQGNDYNNTRPVLKKNTISLFLMPITQLEQLSTEYRNWGLNGEVICWRYRSNATYYEYKFVGNQFTYNTLAARTAGHWYPSYLLNYKNDNLTDYIISYFQGDTSKVIESIENSTQDIVDNQNSNTQDIIANQNQVKDDILNSEVNNESISINTDGLGSSDDYGINNFFTQLLEITQSGLVSRASSSSLDFTLPFINQSVSIPGNIISNAITNWFGVYGDYLISLIHTFWTVYFGSFFVIFAQRMFNWLSTGKIVEKGGYSFIEFLDKQNTIIDSYMM